MDLYEKVVAFVDNVFRGKKKHFERTVYWIEQFIPNATEAQRIAAYSHDIERGIKGEIKRDYLDKDFIERHQKEGAEIMADFLKKEGADDATINTVTHLIGKHEVGGDTEQNALMDADSISFFETNAEMFATERVKTDGYENVKAKLDWMFNRISSEERKNFARENYQKWARAMSENH